MERELFIKESGAERAARKVIAKKALRDAYPAPKFWTYKMPDKSRVMGWAANVVLASGQIVAVEDLA
jgi:hypothetical protein